MYIGFDETSSDSNSSDVKAVSVHDLVPCADEILDELVLVVILSIDFSNGSELRVASKHEVIASRSANEFTG